MPSSLRAVQALGRFLALISLVAFGCSSEGDAQGTSSQTSAGAGTTGSESAPGGAFSTGSTASSSTGASLTDAAASSTQTATTGATGATSAATGAGGSTQVATSASQGGSASLGGGGQSTNGETTNGTGGSSAGGASTAGCEGGGGVSSIVAAHTGDWRIMSLGDSITETTCFPQLISKNLVDDGYSNFEFVGSVLNNQACGATNVLTEGHGGYLVTNLVGSGPNASEPSGWFAAAQAEVVVMHFGTNDVWNDVPAAQITAAYSELLAGLRSVEPNVIVFVAQVVDMNPDGCTECSSRVQALNAAIPVWANAETTCDSPVYVLDLFTGFDTASDTGDGVHPNSAGSQKMADTVSGALLGQGIP